MIYGVGIDLLRVERGQRLWQRHGARAVAKLLHPAEASALSAAKSPGYALARALTVKEAFVKALGTGFIGVGWRDLGCVRRDGERPQLVFVDSLSARLAALGIVAAHVSLSDEAGLVIAVVVLETG